MAAVRISDLSDLIPADFGILAPKSSDAVDPKTLDLVLVPALAVDLFGNRLGFGSGFYDRFLDQVTAKKITVLFDFQVFPELPSDPWDEKIDGYVTERGIFSY